MKLSIEHLTTYRYDEEARHSTQYIRLTPKPSSRQRILNWQLEMPQAPLLSSDGFGNILHVLTLDQPHSSISILARGDVEILDEVQEDELTGLSPLVYLRYTRLTRPSQAITAFMRQFTGEGRPSNTLDRLEALMRGVLEVMPYTPGATHSASSAGEAFALQQGVCQDHTHVFLACARLMALPARYVSGYLYSEDEGHVASHAWAEVWCDGVWHTFDITNQSRQPLQHLKLAVGLDYLDACPVRGVRYGGGPESMHAVATVARLDQ
ncbi:transglutaminase family protein [Alcanivorax sp. JB21]|uniref:transglutaminase family protein n=1 Tax=Alcanivorax limicola TaxID=2874102 RepID=UPI001CBE90E0|nr:transglutaminase family protein [Alcanivorax limicola]MBZ2187467.1 transglutaminase family protein [Alcanivorax limicola]